MQRPLPSVPFVAGALLVAVSLAELTGVAVQAAAGPRDEDWAAVKAHLTASITAADGLVVGARWMEPLARQHLGDGLLTRERLGGEPGTWPSVWVVSDTARGSFLPGYRSDIAQHFGSLVLLKARAENPFRVLARLEAKLPEASVFLETNDREETCTYGTFGAQSGNLGWGPALPAERFTCNGAFLARSVVTDTEYRAHDAIYTDVPGDGRTLIVRWPRMTMGTSLRGGYGLYAEAERDGKGADVRAEWRIDGQSVASLTHRDGEGWKGFEALVPSALQRDGILELRLQSPGGQRRLFGMSAALIEAVR